MDHDTALNEIMEKILGGTIEVHRILGPGLLEGIYESCLACELGQRGLRFDRQKPTPLNYRGMKLDYCYRLDLLVEDRVLVEIKSVEALIPLHTAQVLSYLRLSGFRLGLLINFNVPVLKDGIRRLINGY